MDALMDDVSAWLPWFALNRLPGLGAVSQRELLRCAGGMAALRQADSAQLRVWLPADVARLWLDFCDAGPASALHAQSLRDAESALQAGARVLTADCHQYPKGLWYNAACITTHQGML